MKLYLTISDAEFDLLTATHPDCKIQDILRGLVRTHIDAIDKSDLDAELSELLHQRELWRIKRESNRKTRRYSLPTLIKRRHYILQRWKHDGYICRELLQSYVDEARTYNDPELVKEAQTMINRLCADQVAGDESRGVPYYVDRHDWVEARAKKLFESWQELDDVGRSTNDGRRGD